MSSVAASAFKYSELSADRFESHQLVLQLAAGATRVLELGAATGYMSEALSKQGAHVVAVEVDGDAAGVARQRGIDVRPSINDVQAEEKFDCIVFADVIEHVADAAGFIQDCIRHLCANGVVILSVPNVAHWSLRWSLMNGRFDYTPTGLLDETHLRFYTASTLERLLERNGLHVVEKRYSIGSATYPRWQRQSWRWYQHRLVQKAANLKPELFAYQFVWRAVAEP